MNTTSRVKAANAHQNPGASQENLAAFEDRHGVRLPAAFVALYRKADGNAGDENLTRLWPLAEIHRLSESNDLRGELGALPSDAREYFIFADYLIFSHVYAVRLTSDGRDDRVLWVLDATQRAEIAPSFESFLRAYADDPYSILFPPVSGP